MSRSRDVVCETCQTPFDRGYAINASRAKKPQFCSQECRLHFLSEKAKLRLSSRFWSKVQIGNDEECWEWQGRKGPRGYGVFDYNNRPHVASRFAYLISKGDPGELFVCHTCDNPQCVNPKHLWLGTHADNMADAAQKGRMPGSNRRGKSVNTAKLTENKVLEIRASHLSNRDLADQYGVTPEAISAIKRRINWAWLND